MNEKLKTFLEKTKLVADTITVVLPLARLLLVAAGVLGLVLVIRATGDDKAEQYAAEMRKFKADAELATRYADSLASQVVILENESRAAIARADVFRQSAQKQSRQADAVATQVAAIRATITDSVQMAREIIPLQEEEINELRGALTSANFAMAQLDSAIVVKDSTIGILTVSNDSLRKVIRNIPAPPPPPIFPKVTRKQVFVGGTIIGFITAFVILK